MKLSAIVFLTHVQCLNSQACVLIFSNLNGEIMIVLQTHSCYICSRNDSEQFQALIIKHSCATHIKVQNVSTTKAFTLTLSLSHSLSLSTFFTVLGQVRTTFGQARLLMNKKLKQYLGLVKVAEDQSGERKTTAEDLQVCSSHHGDERESCWDG